MHGPMNVKFIKERVELYLYSTLWAFVACYRVNFTFTFTFTLFIPRCFPALAIKAEETSLSAAP